VTDHSRPIPRENRETDGVKVRKTQRKNTQEMRQEDKRRDRENVTEGEGDRKMGRV